MGLLDSVIGAALGGGSGGGGNNSQAALIAAVLGMLQGGGANAGAAGGGGNLGGLGGMLGQVLGGAGGSSMSGGGAGGGLGGLGGLAGGGLGGLLEQFSRAGLGDTAKSWVSTGENMPVSPAQVSDAFGQDAMGSLAAQLGMPQGEVAGQLSQILPGLVDQLTPQGRIPQGDVQAMGADDLIGMLGGLLGRR